MIAPAPPPTAPREPAGADASARSPWPHRAAWVLVLVTVIGTVGLGATVTTLGAGMAFLDWPTSGGENMFLYNFFHDIKVGETDKVLEHVHRLAGATTGVLAIALAALLWRADRRRWATGLGLTILGMVILQGLAGGFRVTEVSTTLAMLHGHFGACVVAVMFAAVLVTGRGWRDAPAGSNSPAVTAAGRLTLAALLLLVGQYALGGVLRHFGALALYHVGGAVLVGLLAAAAAGAAVASGHRFLRAGGWLTLAALGGQITLGLLAWATRFGVTAVGAVAEVGGPLEVVSRGGHTVVGMLLLSALLTQYLRARRLSRPAAVTVQEEQNARPVGVNRLERYTTPVPVGGHE